MPSSRAVLRAARSLRTVAGGTDRTRLAWLRDLTAREGHANVFNVSLAVLGDRLVVAWRALPHAGAERPFRAYVATVRADGTGTTPVIDLWEAGIAGGAPTVADPKLFVAHGAVYATFNTGFVRAPERNDVYVMRVWPHLRPPQRCDLPKRRRIEKNWAFLEHPDGLAAVHRLDPLVVLAPASGVLGDDEPLGLRRPDGWQPTPGPLGLTLGTQPLVEGDRALAVVHQKYRLRDRSLYVGRPATFVGLGGRSPRVQVGAERLVHNRRAMLPQRQRFHPNLFSVTYFSGLARVDGHLTVGYGINDHRPGIARVPEDWWS